jgi:hypothetical protein
MAMDFEVTPGVWILSWHYQRAASTWMVLNTTSAFQILNCAAVWNGSWEAGRLIRAAQARTGASFSTGAPPFAVLFRFVEEHAHRHEHGLSAVMVILQNGGEMHF